MLQYGIYRVNNGGTPFMIDFYDNITLAKLRINNLVEYWEKKGLHYYIDNDYFENKYSINEKLFYCCIKIRNVDEWKNYNEFQRKNNIIDFLKYKKLN